MVVFELHITADLENVDQIIAPDNHVWSLDVKQSTGDEVRENITVSAAEEFDMANSRGKANFIVKFKDSKHQATMNVVQDRTIKPYTADDDGKPVLFAAFDCRGGVEPFGWHPREGYTIVSSGGTTFTNVSLQEMEWVDFCEKRQETVGIYNLKYTLDVNKKH